MIYAVCNQKGGVGKTTTSVNLAASLADSSKKTLLIDMDPQGNAGSGIGVNKHRVEKSIYHALIGEASLSSCIRKSDFDNLYICPANRDLIGAEIELVSAFARENKLKNAFQDVQGDYDYIIIDCPPSLNLLTVNALNAADAVLVPVQCEYYALEGISELMNTIKLIQDSLNPQLKLGGVLLTMFDQRNNLSHQVESEVRDYFKEKVFQTRIPRSVKLSESPSHGKPIHVYDSKSVGAESYLSLAKEIINQEDRTEKGGLVLLNNEVS